MENQTKQKNGKVNKKILIYIICVLVLIGAGVGIYLFIANKAGNPEKLAQTYIEAMKESNSDKIMQITDAKAACAWEKCEGDAQKFKETYKNVSDDEVNQYKNKMKESLDAAMSMLKTFGGVQITYKSVEKPEEISNGLYKCKVNMEMEVFGQQQELIMVIYNGKFIGTISE